MTKLSLCFRNSYKQAFVVVVRTFTMENATFVCFANRARNTLDAKAVPIAQNVLIVANFMSMAKLALIARNARVVKRVT